MKNECVRLFVGATVYKIMFTNIKRINIINLLTVIANGTGRAFVVFFVGILIDFSLLSEKSSN